MFFYDTIEEILKRNEKKNFIIEYDETCNIKSYSLFDIQAASIDVYNVLHTENVLKNDIIGILCEHCSILPILILGINRNNSSFICMDPNELEKSINIISYLNIKWVLNYTKSNTLENFVLQRSLKINNVTIELWHNPHNKISSDFKDVCYTIQTSGTTGEPKIIKVLNYCIMSNIFCLREKFNITSDDVIYFGTPCTFDPFIVELFLSFLTGASLLIVPKSIKLNTETLTKILFPDKNKIYSGVTFLQMPPSIFMQFSHENIKNVIFGENSTLKILALGGEKFPIEFLSQFLKLKKNQTRIFNLYGITEVSCWASIFELTEDYYKEKKIIPLGKVLNDTLIEIRDENGKTVQNGEGEIFIGSHQRICLLNQEIEENLNKPIFRSTGDIGKIDVSKNIFYLGRKDNIIKRYGNRVNMSLIEDTVSSYTQTSSTCIWNDDKLILFYVEYDKSVQSLRKFLLSKLPKEAYPDIIKSVDYLPLTKHGKIDKQSILKLVENEKQNSGFDSKEVLTKLICDYCGVDENDLKHSFRDLGGTSIIAVQIMNEYEKSLNKSFPMNLFGMMLDKKIPISDYWQLLIENKSIDFKHKIDSSSSEENLVIKKNRKDTVSMKIKWKVDLKACIDATPIVFDLRSQSVSVIGSHSGLFMLIDNASGKIISEYKFSDRIEGTACITSCKLYAIIGCYDGYLYCLNILNNTLKWKYKTGERIKCTPVLCQNNEAVVIGSYDKYVHCVDVQNGSSKWKNNVFGSITSTPLVDNGHIYIATTKGDCFSFTEQGDLIWKTTISSPIFGTGCMLPTKNNLMIAWPNVKGSIICFNANNGEKVWEYNTNGIIYSSLVYFNGGLYFGCYDEHLYCLQVTGLTLDLKFKVNCYDKIYSTPFVYCDLNNTNCIVACCSGKMYNINCDSMEITASINLPGELFSSPYIVNNIVYIGCRDNNLYSIIQHYDV